MNVEKSYLEKRISQLTLEIQNPTIQANAITMAIKQALLKEFKEALKTC